MISREEMAKKIGLKINFYRKNSQFTLLELSKKVNLSEGMVSRYENGEIKTVSIDTLVKFANALGCSPSDLMDWNLSDSPSPEKEQLFLEKFKKLGHDDQMLLLDNMDNLSDSLCLTSLEKKRINKCRQLSPDDVEDIDEMIDFKLDKALRKERAIQNAAI